MPVTPCLMHSRKLVPRSKRAIRDLAGLVARAGVAALGQDPGQMLKHFPGTQFVGGLLSIPRAVLSFIGGEGERACSFRCLGNDPLC